MRQWYIIREGLKELYHCQFTRNIGLDQKVMVKYQILVFCDASKYAYVAAVYLRQENEVSCKVSKGAKIRNRYNQVTHLTQDTNWKVTNSQ